MDSTDPSVVGRRKKTGQRPVFFNWQNPYWLAPEAATAADAAVSEAAAALDAASLAEAAASLALAAALDAATPASEAAADDEAAASLVAALLLLSSFLPQAPNAKDIASTPATMRVLFMITSLYG